MDNAKASVELAKINLGYTQVTAPFDGVVTRHLVDIGALVGYSGPTKLASIVQVRPIYVYFTVSEDVVLRVKRQLAQEGQKVRDLYQVPVEIGLMSEAGYPRSGRLDYVAPQVSTATGTLDVRALFDNGDGGRCRAISCGCAFPCNKPKTRSGWMRRPSARTSSASMSSFWGRTMLSNSVR